MGRERKTTNKTCVFCKTNFVAKSKSAKYCSTNCRQDAYLKRKNKEDSGLLEKEIEHHKSLKRGLELIFSKSKGKAAEELEGFILIQEGYIVLKQSKLNELLH